STGGEMTELRFVKLRRLFVLLYVVLIVSPNPGPRFRGSMLYGSRPATGEVLLATRNQPSIRVHLLVYRQPRPAALLEIATDCAWPGYPKMRIDPETVSTGLQDYSHALRVD